MASEEPAQVKHITEILLLDNSERCLFVLRNSALRKTVEELCLMGCYAVGLL
jgi:hypothetical protein